jgi:hypothetical protein
MGSSNNKNYTITTLCGSMRQYIERWVDADGNMIDTSRGPIIRVGVIRQASEKDCLDEDANSIVCGGYPYTVVRGTFPSSSGSHTSFIFGGAND